MSRPKPAPTRLMVPVTDLIPHPDNPRGDLDLNPGFTGSFADSGVLVPLRVTPRDDGGYWVIDGARRLAGAARAGLAEVPCDLIAERAGDRAGQLLDMVTTSEQRNGLKPAEVAAALFTAHQAGATKTRIRKATGLDSQEVTDALTAGKLSASTRNQASAAERELTLHELAILAEFDDDPDAVTRLTRAATAGLLDHEAELIRAEHAEQAEQDRRRAELEAAGITITDALPDGAKLIYQLSHDGAELTHETHASCPGRGAIFYPAAPAIPSYYCADPAAYGHADRWQRPDTAPGAGHSAQDSQPQPPGTDDTQPGSDRNARRLVIDGNRAWHAAATVRHRWLVTLFARRTAPPEVARFLAAQLLTMSDPLRSGLSQAGHWLLFKEITGHHADQLAASAGTAAAGRLPLLMLAPVVVAYEHAMTDGEPGKATWRPDKYSPCPRNRAGTYLKFLASLGYQLSGIEQAVADGLPYTGPAPDYAGSEELTPVQDTASSDNGCTGMPAENHADPADPAQNAA